MMERVLIPQSINAKGVRYLEERGYQAVQGSGTDEETIAREIPGCAGLIIRNARVTRRIIDAGDCLRVIARHGVGTDNIDVAYAQEKGIAVTNGPFANTNSVAEHTIFLLLTCANRCRAIHDGLYRGEAGYAVREQITKIELAGKTLGIVGPGRIGRSVAQKAHYGFGMRIVAYHPRRPADLPDYIALTDSLEALLAESDFVSLHMPSMTETRGMIGEAALRTMKPTAYLVNCARGDAVDEAALVRALQDGTIAGAALDVLAGEPYDRSHPLFRLPNVFITPHNASHTQEGFENMALHAAQGIHEVLSGGVPTWPVRA